MLTWAVTGDDGRGTRRLHAKPNPMKAVFWTYVLMICAGLVYFSVIGLTHN
jgi:hypothetical protein